MVAVDGPVLRATAGVRRGRVSEALAEAGG